MTRSHLRPRRSTAARVGSGLVNVLAIVATLVGVAYLVPSLVGYERYVITGGSMSGTFEKGSIAFEKPIPVEDVKVGDVITYLPPADSGVSTLVTHRIINDTILDTGVRQVQTQGDANPDPDPWKFTFSAETQPVVQTTVPYAGWVFIALADRETRMLVIGIPAALVALASLVELTRAIGGGRRDKPGRDMPASPVAERTAHPASSVMA